MKSKSCDIKFCKRKYHAKKYCLYHYRRYKEFNNPLYEKPKRIYHKKENAASRQPEYTNWAHAKARSSKSNSGTSNSYYDKGIRMYEPLRKRNIGFWLFLEHIGRKPSGEYSIDRINNDEGYFPGNVRWATRKQQQNNKRQANQYIKKS